MIGKIQRLYKNSKGFLSVFARFEENGKTYELLINKTFNDYNLYCMDDEKNISDHKSFKGLINKIKEAQND